MRGFVLTEAVFVVLFEKLYSHPMVFFPHGSTFSQGKFQSSREQGAAWGYFRR